MQLICPRQISGVGQGACTSRFRNRCFDAPMR
jgi:hypothetical protein